MASKFAGTKLAKGFETDPAKEQDGVWRVHPDSGIHVRVRRATNTDHKLALRKHWRPFAHLTRVHPRDELLVKQKAAAETLVADWGQTLEDENGQPVLDGQDLPVRGHLLDGAGSPIPPTHDNVLDAFTAMPDFFAWVSEEADTFESYRASVVESAGGNSAPSSLGSESGALPTLPHSSSAELPAVSQSAPSPVAPS